MPEALAKFLFPTCRASKFRNARVQTDFPYNPGRLADLAFLDAEDRVIGLVEVKEEDQLGPGTGDQTQDYLSYVRKNSTQRAPVHFAYVTKHLPSEKSSLVLQISGVKPTYYSELYDRFSKYLADPKLLQRSPVTQLFCRYLQEEGVVYQMLTPEDENTLRLLLRQGFGMRGMTGFGKDVTAERQMQVPILLGTLLANVQAMGIEFHNRFKDQLGNRFVPKFAFYPAWQMKKVSKRLKDPDWYDEIDVIDPDLCDGGALYLWSEGRLRSEDPCYVWLGYEFDLSLSEKEISKHLYAGVGVGNRQFQGFSEFTSFPNYGKAQNGARTIMRNQIREAVQGGNAPGGKHLSSLQKALEKH